MIARHGFDELAFGETALPFFELHVGFEQRVNQQGAESARGGEQACMGAGHLV